MPTPHTMPPHAYPPIKRPVVPGGPAAAPTRTPANPAPAAANPYLRTKVLTASPAELRLMLFDGALKFARQTRRLMEAEKRDLEAIFESALRTQKIVLELSSSLTRDNGDELYEKLTALYHFIYTRLVDANIKKDVGALDEAIKLLAYERETWAMAMEEMAAARANGANGAAGAAHAPAEAA